jgi:tetratricopeptide (TPR) repeat protein
MAVCSHFRGGSSPLEVAPRGARVGLTTGTLEPATTFSMNPSPSFPLSPRQQAIALAAITAVVFAPTLWAEFVYDARLQILTDPFLHDAANWFDVLTFRVLARDVLDFNRPVHLASLMLDAAVWGRDPFGFHLTSVLLHSLNVVLLWGVIRGLLTAFREGQTESTAAAGRNLTAALAALLFAVHPLVTEAVCEPTFREDLLAATFTLAALLFALHAQPAAPRWRAAAVAVCCLLAVASKESGLAAPLVVAAFWWLFRRDEPRGFPAVAIGGGLALVAAFLAARFLLEPSPSRIFESKPEYPGGSLTAALGLLPRILALYAQLILLPIKQCADYGLVSVGHLPLPVAIMVIAATIGLLAWAARRDRRIALGIALLVLPLVPVANLVPIYRAAADRYLYLPLAGAACIVACLLDSAWVRGHDRRRLLALLGAVTAAVLLAAACVERQRVWSRSLPLWEDTARRNPASFTALHGLAGALREAGRLPEAERAAREAIRLSGERRGDAFVTLAFVLDDQGRTADADAALAQALDLDSRLADPEARVAALAMERTEADRLTALLRRRAAPAEAGPIVPEPESP